jgi:LPXTG-motif cell wall-anchored protein
MLRSKRFPMAADCPVKVYDFIDQPKIDTIIKELQGQGATITGQNPWQVDVHKGGVILGAAWDRAASRLVVTILDKSGWASCDRVWNAIDPQLKTVQAQKSAAVTGSSDADILKGIASSGTPLSDADRTSFKAALDALEAKGDAPSPVAPPVASAAAAVTGSSKTALYVVGGALVLGAAYLLMKKRASHSDVSLSPDAYSI